MARKNQTFLLCIAAYASVALALEKRELDCPVGNTKITGPTLYSDTQSCAEIISQRINGMDPLYVSECERQLGYPPEDTSRGVQAYVHVCMPFSNGTVRYRTQICCPGEPKGVRCFTCENEDVKKDELSKVYETHYCNAQPLQECAQDEFCMTRYDYSIGQDGTTQIKVTKGCEKKQECNDARAANSDTCIDDITNPSCTSCCKEAFCNERKHVKKINVLGALSDDPCNERNGLENPCLNGGTCVPTNETEPAFICKCPDDRHGDTCQYDACEVPFPCAEQSSCKLTKSAPYFKCHCRTGHYGDKCTEEYEKCQENICLNGGTCYQQKLYQRCLCPSGYLGEKCEITAGIKGGCSSPDLHMVNDVVFQVKSREKSRQTCTSKAAVVESSYTSKAWLALACNRNLFPQFVSGMDGNVAKMRVAETAMHSCEQGDDIFFYKVEVCCPSCLSEPCLNGGWCIQDGKEFICKCRYGYTGDQCQYKTKMCVISGDPHYFTFDGQHITFQGGCKYDLVSLPGSTQGIPEFHVYSKNEHRDGNTEVSYLQYVEVQTRGMVFRILRTKRVLVNGFPLEDDFELSTYANGSISLQRNGEFVQIRTDFGLVVQYDGVWIAEIKLPSVLANEVNGLCGNNNGDPDDDLKTRSGHDVSDRANSYSLVGNSWKVDDSEDEQCSPDTKPNPTICDETVFPQIDDKEYCGLLTTAREDSPFFSCFLKHTDFIEMFTSSCHYDVCANNGSRDAVCGSLHAAAQACADNGFSINWRSEDFCPMECKGGSVYEFRGPACPITCSSPLAAELCSLQDTEICVCPGRQVWRGDQCVEREECGCHRDDEEYQIGTSWLTDDCTQQYSCELCEDCHDGFGQIEESPFTCDTNCVDGECGE